MNPQVESMLRKTRAFLRGLEATFDEFIAQTVERGETLLAQERPGPPPTPPASPAHAAPRDESAAAAAESTGEPPA